MAGPVEWCSPDNHTCSFVSRPLVEPVRRDQATAMFHGITKSGLVGSSLRHRVDGLESNGRVFGPVGNQSPTEQRKAPLRLFPVLTDNGNLLCGRNIPAWCPGKFSVDAKVVAKVTLLRGESITPAHGASV